MIDFFQNCKNLKCLVLGLISLCLIQKSVGIHLANVSISSKYIITTDACVNLDYGAKSVHKKDNFNNISISSQLLKYFLYRNLSTHCKDSLANYYKGAINLKPWALDMLDASGKIPSSFFSITMIDYGSPEDCIKIKAITNYGDALFKGKFCMLHLRHPLFQTPHHNQLFIDKSYAEVFGEPPDWIKYDIDNYVPLRFGYYGGICVPSTCTDEELGNVISALVEPFDLDSTLSDCQVEEPRKVPAYAKLIMLVFVVILCVCITGTILDLNDLKKENKVKLQEEGLNRQLLKSFSVYTNVKELFAETTDKSSLQYIHGFRTMLCFGIIWTHSLIFPTQWKELRYRNFHFVFEVINLIVENNGIIIVDFFFTMGGFLLVYSVWKKLEESNGHFNAFEYILQRYWRLTPSQIFVLLFLIILPIFSTGPIWNSSMQHELENCYRNGWRNLLYIQNYNNITDICMTHTWYIGTAMQHLVVSIPLMIITFRYPKTGITLGLLLFIVPNIYYFYLSLKMQLPFAAFTSVRYTHFGEALASIIYVWSSYHLSPNLIGMLAGWICYKYGKRKISKMWLITGWSISVLLFLHVAYSILLPTKDLRIMAFYNVSRTSAIGMTTSWIFYACGSGQGGVVDRILSARVLVPLSRISYSVYLIHPLYLVFRDSVNAERYYMDRITHVVDFVPYTLWSIFAGFIVYILIEEPFNKMYGPLKKRITGSSKSRQKESTTIGN